MRISDWSSDVCSSDLLYFGSDRPGGHGAGDIYAATQSPSGEWKVENLGPPISTAADDYEAEISRNGRTMIVVSDRGDKSHLYRFVLKNGKWAETGRSEEHTSELQSLLRSSYAVF